MARFGFCTASSLIWGEWGFALSFYSIHDSLRASIGVSHSVMYSNHDMKSALKLFKAKCFQSKPGHLSVNSYKTEELRLFDLYKINKKFTYRKPVWSAGCIINYKRVLLRARRKKKTWLCPIHCNYSRTSLFRTRLIRSPRYFERRSNALGFTIPLYASPVISKPRYFELFFISLGTSK